MIGPIPAPDMGDPWDGDPNTQAAWRERERRQRSVRLLMMFLLMLLLMDGEEQSTRRRNDPNFQLRKRKNSKKSFLLEDHVFNARRDQEDRLLKVTRTHPRFMSLLDLNGKSNHETLIRQWADQQQEDEEDSSKEDKTKKIDPEDEKKVWHYPWNSTGFYRGQWFREGNDDEEEENEDRRHGDEESTPVQYLSTIDLEGPMKERMSEMEEKVGVYLLPRGTKMKMHNYTATKADQATAEAVISAQRARSRPAPSWMSLGQPELNELIAKAEDENEPPAQVTLTKEHGRAAFQFYSRSVPAMKELSLVDGFVKLYDSNTVGYSTRRDMLLRVRGVLIHSIGRISLVSNADPGRSALIVSDYSEKKPPTEKQPPTKKEKTNTDAKPDEETETKRRRLSELVASIDPNLDKEDLERIRDDVLDLYRFDVMDDDDDGDWEVMQSVELELPIFSQFERAGWLFDMLNRFWEPSHEIPSHERPVKFNRRLSELVENKTDTEPDGSSNGTLSNVSGLVNSTVTSLFDENTTLVERRIPQRNLKQASAADGSDPEATSKVVIPYPYVPDDKHETVRKAKTAAARRMPPREQLLEANAGRCEFEINLDVKELEWTLGEWKTLMAQHVLETRHRDPKLHKKEPEEGDNEDDEDDEGSSKGTHMKTKHAESTTGRNERPIVKPIQVEALVMAMSGSIHSPNCDFTSSLNATAIRTDWEHTTAQAINYSFYMMLACLAQIVVLLRQLLHTQHQSTATRVSLLCIGWQTVLDALLCLCHIYLSLHMHSLLTAFASVAFFKLLIFCVIEMKYMAIIIQARNNANGGQSTTELLRRQVAMLHLRFYVALVGAFTAFIYAGQQYRTIYMLGLYSFWVPQIVQNIITEAKRPLHTYYIYGMSVSRCVAPLYMFATKDNFLKEVFPELPTNYFINYFMVQMLVLWIGLQTAVLIAQGKYGARFMIPARFLPPKFDYHRKIPPSMIPDGSEQKLERDRTPSPPPLKSDNSEPRNATGARNRLKGGRSNPEQITTIMTTDAITLPAATIDCVICCNGIDHRNRKGYMLAPCDHIFHKDCLIQWMDVKMECPICRTELPAI